MRGGYLLGVDFGTSNTVAVLRDPDGRARPLLFDGAPQLPSAVFVSGPTRLAGRDALHRGLSQPAGLEPNPKRRIDDGSVLLSSSDISVAELIAVVLGRVKDEATLAAGGPVGSLTLTCPAFWGRRRSGVLTSAAELAGLPTPVLVREPVAAAHYSAFADPVLVYDLGAGTCDVSVVRGGDVVASHGLDGVGGLDIDAAVVESLAAEVRPDDPAWERLRRPQTPADLRARNTLWDGARGAKEQLSRTASTFVFVPLLDVEAPIGREQFDALATPVLRRTVELARSVVKEAGLKPDQLATVLLVGGSSRLPLAGSLLHRALGVAPTLVDQPELAVALGSVKAPAQAAPWADTLPPPWGDEPTPWGDAPTSPAVSLDKPAESAPTARQRRTPAPEDAGERRDNTPPPAATAPPALPRAAATPPGATAVPTSPGSGTAPSGAANPAPRRAAPTREIAVFLVVLLVAVTALAVIVKINYDKRNPGAQSGPSASPTPSPTGPPGDLSVAPYPDTDCRIGRLGPNSIFVDTLVIPGWSAADNRPPPAGVAIELVATNGKGKSAPVRVSVDQSMQPVGQAADVPRGFVRITGDDGWLGAPIVVRIAIDGGLAVADTNPGNNALDVGIFMPGALNVSGGPMPCSVTPSGG